MLGLGDWGVGLAFVLTLGATALCAVYGFFNWNEPGPEIEVAEIAEEIAWENGRERDDEMGRAGEGGR